MMRDRGRRTNTAVFMVVLVFLTFEVGSRGSYTQDVPHIIKTENIQHIPGYASFGTGVSDEDSPPLFDWLPPASIILPLRSPLSFTMLNAVGGGGGGKNETSERASRREARPAPRHGAADTKSKIGVAAAGIFKHSSTYQVLVLITTLGQLPLW